MQFKYPRLALDVPRTATLGFRLLTIGGKTTGIELMGKPPLPPSDRRRYARKIDPAVTALLAYMEIEYKLKAKWCHRFTKDLANHVLTKLQPLPPIPSKKIKKRKREEKQQKPNLQYLIMAEFVIAITQSRAFNNSIVNYYQIGAMKRRGGSPNPNNHTPAPPIKPSSMEPKPIKPSSMEPKPKKQATALPRPSKPSDVIHYVNHHAGLLASVIQKEFNLHGQWSRDYNHDLVQLALHKLRSNSPTSTDPVADVGGGIASPSKKL
ncbi:hypothetical protein AAHA92_13468 [Salvia divinorum]|uniref:Uncharacterized protein n=1 Tax=Salvia divinorum TaxID=28513 RepID=A0ABD1HCI1_SALDI